MDVSVVPRYGRTVLGRAFVVLERRGLKHASIPAVVPGTSYDADVCRNAGRNKGVLNRDESAIRRTSGWLLKNMQRRDPRWSEVIVLALTLMGGVWVPL